jgi:hypothetical protein
MNAKPVALPPQLRASTNEFLTQANEMLKTDQSYDSVSASLLYAAACFNVHGFVNQDGERQYAHADFVAYMTDLYRRMLEEQIALRSGKGAAK